jgi:hypothetical protein
MERDDDREYIVEREQYKEETVKESEDTEQRR